MKQPIATMAMAGNPNAGKSALFNMLTGSSQKVGNFSGVTVEQKTGDAKLANGESIRIIDLPGTYSIDAQSPDEIIAQQILLGLRKDSPRPDLLLVTIDVTH